MRPSAASLEKSREILGVERDASIDDIRQSWLDLVKVWHPDRFEGDPRLARKAAEQLKAINEAWEILRDSPPDPMSPLLDYLEELRRRP